MAEFVEYNIFVGHSLPCNLSNFNKICDFIQLKSNNNIRIQWRNSNKQIFTRLKMRENDLEGPLWVECYDFSC